MRHMKQARRVDNGELVQGYYTCIAGELHIIHTGKIDIRPLGAGGKLIWECFEVDPATVEDMAVNPIFDGKLFACPNCGAIELHNSRNIYCPDCGQRIDWSGEDGK